MRKQQITDINQLKNEIEQWRNKYLRALADYQNLEKRVREARVEEAKFASLYFMTKMLPVFDNLEKAAAIIGNNGLNLAVKQLQDLLKSEKIEKIEVVGKKFEPLYMECVEIVNSDKEEIVLDEVSPGYKMYDKVIRPAKVKVGKKQSTENKTQEKKNQE